MNFGTYGFRWAGKIQRDKGGSAWDYGVEMARQSGSLGSDSIGAWAGHWVVGRTFAAQLHPRVSLEYNFASGDHNSKDGKHGTFDQLYPSAHDKYGLADQVGWKNIRDARAGLELKPWRKFTLVGRYNAWWLADSHDALYTATSSVVARVTAGNAGRFVGQELDSVAVYTLSPSLQFGGGFGHIFPGTFLNHATPGNSYNFPYASTTLTF